MLNSLKMPRIMTKVRTRVAMSATGWASWMPKRPRKWAAMRSTGMRNRPWREIARRVARNP